MLQNQLVLLCHHLYYKDNHWGKKLVVSRVDAFYELSFLCMDFRGIIWIYVLLRTNGFCLILGLSAYCLR